MTYVTYEEWNPTPETKAKVETAEKIIKEYEAQGFSLTLRQLYYQFVARDLIPNTERSYKNLGNLIVKARMAGMISWRSIEDRTRTHHAHWFEEDDSVLINNLSGYIRFDQWARQDWYVEVWVEKQALGDVIARACDPLLVPHMACKGYLSASESWRAGMRYARQAEKGKYLKLIHLGDHDPSGMDMTRDNGVRLMQFSNNYGIDIRRIALNMDQIEEYDPPPNPTKYTDSRAQKYISEFGDESWELDALEPAVLVDLVTKEIKELIDEDLWTEVKVEEYKVKSLLEKLGEQWPTIKENLEEE